MAGRVGVPEVGITAQQRVALEHLAPALPDSTYLAGGVAVAIRCKHRTSLDLDLFTPDDAAAATFPALDTIAGVVITQREPRTVYLEIDGIPASILTYPYPQLQPPEAVPGLAVPIASVSDLITMKLAAIVSRGAARDFWDLHELIVQSSLTLPDALELHQRRFPRHDIGHVIRALVYFAEAEPFPMGLAADQWTRIKNDFESWVRDFARM